MSKFNKNLDKKVKEITDLLKSKNKAYGNSALNPANIFSQADAVDSLSARIDDKLMRIKNKGIYDATEDTVHDLIGYLLLLSMAIDEKNYMGLPEKLYCTCNGGFDFDVDKSGKKKSN